MQPGVCGDEWRGCPPPVLPWGRRAPAWGWERGAEPAAAPPCGAAGGLLHHARTSLSLSGLTGSVLLAPRNPSAALPEQRRGTGASRCRQPPEVSLLQRWLHGCVRWGTGKDGGRPTWGTHRPVPEHGMLQGPQGPRSPVPECRGQGLSRPVPPVPPPCRAPRRHLPGTWRGQWIPAKLPVDGLITVNAACGQSC